MSYLGPPKTGDFLFLNILQKMYFCMEVQNYRFSLFCVFSKRIQDIHVAEWKIPKMSQNILKHLEELWNINKNTSLSGKFSSLDLRFVLFVSVHDCQFPTSFLAGAFVLIAPFSDSC